MTRRNSLFLAAAIVVVAIAGAVWAYHESQKACCAFPDDPSIEKPKVVPFEARERRPLGLMTSLPIFWPAGANIAEMASGDVEPPVQRKMLETYWDLVPLDTLSPIAGLAPDAPPTDPLAGLQQIAIIQPRALTPLDNVALDDWVRAGGRVLLVLDPMLTGQYDFALGDPRRPVDAALIPPVVKRWGLTIVAGETEGAEIQHVLYDPQVDHGDYIMRSVSGQVLPAEGANPDCDFYAERIIAQCRVGEGLVTLVADAASFEFAVEPFMPDARSRVPLYTLPLFAFP